MGKAKKIVTTGQAPAASPPMSNDAALRAQLQAVQAEIQQIHLTGDVEKVSTGLRLAALQQRVWDLEGMLATDINVRLACARQSTASGEQVVRCAKALQVDLLKDLFAKAEAMEQHQGALKGLK